ncbi:hypothetical protein [Roseateles sp. P5_E7]
MNKMPAVNRDWYKSVCRPPVSQAPTNLSPYVTLLPTSSKAPIDRYLAACEILLKKGDPAFFAAHPEIANLMLVAAVSQTENYFRDLFSRLLVVCPVSQGKSAQRDIKLGSVIWYRVGQIERGAFEHFSFAGMDSIIETLSRYFDVQLDQKSDPYALLQNFDKMCEIRHAIVHSAGVVSGKNATKLQLRKTKSDMEVVIDFQRFQEVVQLCTALVCSINIELFRRFGERWRDKWPTHVSPWTGAIANARFRDLWLIFASDLDRAVGLPARALSCAQCRGELLTP